MGVYEDVVIVVGSAGLSSVSMGVDEDMDVVVVVAVGLTGVC